MFRKKSIDCISSSLLITSSTVTGIISIFREMPVSSEVSHESMREVGLPGAMGSKDIVHVKWPRAPAGNFNHCKGKESYPNIAFEYISNFEQMITGKY
jgi:hypothetical protein